LTATSLVAIASADNLRTRYAQRKQIADAAANPVAGEVFFAADRTNEEAE